MTPAMGRIRGTVAVGATFAVALALATPAFGDRAFSPRFSQNVPGGNLTIAANTLLSCPAAAPDCLAARAGTATGAALSNNAYAMAYVDVDADPTTFSSSRAQLNLPAGAEVAFAGLYFGGRTPAGTGGAPAPNPAARAQARLAVPGASSYQTVTGIADDATSVVGAYQGFVDVTQQVSGAGPGVYTVADAQAGTGLDRYSGWALVVAYRYDGEPPRNLTVFDGLQLIQQGDPPLTIPASGFETPETGAVRTRVGFVVYEGDRGASGDRARLNGRLLADAANPANNFFNSAISVDGVDVTSRDPDYLNQLGFDAILTRADGYLANGDTSATIELSTTLDQYGVGVVTFATELNPAIVEDLVIDNPPPGGGDAAKLGEKLEYTIELGEPELRADRRRRAGRHQRRPGEDRGRARRRRGLQRRSARIAPGRVRARHLGPGRDGRDRGHPAAARDRHPGQHGHGQRRRHRGFDGDLERSRPPRPRPHGAQQVGAAGAGRGG